MRKSTIIGATIALVITLLVADHLYGRDAYVPVKSNGGWETSQVNASVRRNYVLGVIISFQFPKIPDECDSPVLSDVIAKNGGLVIESGGYRGAPMIAVFRNVIDLESADRKIVEVLPQLSKAAYSLSSW